MLTNLFHDAYFAVYEGNLPGMSVEMVGIRVTALADAVSLADGILAQSATGAGNMRQRSVYVASERRSIVVPVIQREDVGAKATDGPAIVESPYTTIVVDAGWTFRSDAVGSLHLDHVAAAPTEAAK